MKRVLLILLFLTSCTPGARYSLHEDNDYFKPTQNNDKDFTQGAEFSREKDNETYAFGQLIYTPDHKQLEEAQPGKRPYAGFLYGAYSKKDVDAGITYGLKAGIIGPHSYAEQAQNGIHRLLGQHTAKGWGNQLGDEPGLILEGTKKFNEPLNSYLDVTETFGADLGNVFTQAFSGAELRVGYNLPNYMGGPSPIYPRIDQESDQKHLSYYLFTGPYVRYVLRNIFLDGNTFKDSLSVDKYPFVAEGRLGLGIEYGLYRVSYIYAIQTHEYHGEDNGNDFGEINLSVGW